MRTFRFTREKLSLSWMKEFSKKGGISGLESLVRNAVYTQMIVRMVHVVNEQGTYWVVNHFFGGWLLLLITQPAEVIKQELSTEKTISKK